MVSSCGESPCFRGLVIHCNAFLDDGMPMVLQNAIENGGGIYSSKLIPSRVTHVVWRNGSNATMRTAERNNIYIVGPSWIHESVKTGRREDEANFPPCEVGQSKTPRSARKLWRNSLDDMSRLASPDDFRFSSSQPDPELLVEQEASISRSNAGITNKGKQTNRHIAKRTKTSKKIPQSKMPGVGSTTTVDLDGDLTSGTNVWTCERCTLINNSSSRRCAACDHRKSSDASILPFVRAARDVSSSTTTTSTIINNNGHNNNNNEKRSCSLEKRPSTGSKQLKLSSMAKENVKCLAIDDAPPISLDGNNNDYSGHLHPSSVMNRGGGGGANTSVVATVPKHERNSPVKFPSSAPRLQGAGDNEKASPHSTFQPHSRKRASGDSLRNACKRPQIALSGHGCDSKKTLAMAAKFLPHDIISDEQVKKCTHLVIRDDGQRTIKILFALCYGGKKIVHGNWILESLSNGKWLDEKAYESRRYSRQAPSHPLQGMLVYISESTDPPRSTLEKLAKASGAKTVNSISTAELLIVGSLEDGKKLIQNCDSNVTAMAEANRIRTSRWLFDSIEGGKRVNIEDDDRYTVHVDVQDDEPAASQDF